MYIADDVHHYHRADVTPYTFSPHILAS